MGMSSVLIKGADDYSASSAEEASHIAVAVPAMLYSVIMYNNNASTRYLQVFDSATLPADATVPILTVAVPAGSTASFDFISGMPFSSGIVVCNSSTDTVKTIGGADSLFTVLYRR